MQFTKFLKEHFSYKGKMNRTHFLAIFFVGLLIFPFGFLFLSLGFNKSDYLNIYLVLYSFIWLYGLLCIGYKRYKDIYIDDFHGIYVIYVIGILFVFYGAQFFHLYALLGLLPVLLGIVAPGKKIEESGVNNIHPPENKASFREDFLEQLLFYKKYDYNFRQLLTFRVLVATILFGLFIYGGIQSVIYEYKNYGKEVIVLADDSVINNNTFVEIDISNFDLIHIDNSIANNYEDQSNKPKNIISESFLFGKEFMVHNDKFDKLIIDADDITLAKNLFNKKETVIRGKIVNYNGGYKLYLGQIPQGDGLGMLIFVLFIFLVYLIILFKDVASLKNLQVDNKLFNLLNELSYSKLLDNINSYNNINLSMFTLLNRIIFNSLDYYKNNLLGLNNINLKEILDFEDEITLGLVLKDNIKKLDKNESETFFRNEENNIALILGYIIDKVNKNAENEIFISRLEEIIEQEQGKKTIKKLIKDSNYIYNEIIKNILPNNLIKKEYFIFSEFILHYSLVITTVIVYHRLLKDDKDIFTTALHILNPLSLVTGKIIKKMKGY